MEMLFAGKKQGGNPRLFFVQRYQQQRPWSGSAQQSNKPRTQAARQVCPKSTAGNPVVLLGRLRVRPGREFMLVVGAGMERIPEPKKIGRVDFRAYFFCVLFPRSWSVLFFEFGGDRTPALLVR